MNTLLRWVKRYYTFCFVMLNFIKPKRNFIGLEDGDNISIYETQESKDKNLIYMAIGFVMLILPVVAPIYWTAELYQYLNSEHTKSNKIAFENENQQNIKSLLRSTMANFNKGNLDILIKDVDHSKFYKNKFFKSTDEYFEISSYYRASKIIKLITKEKILKLSNCSTCPNLYEQMTNDDAETFALKIYKRLMPSVDPSIRIGNITELYEPTLKMVNEKIKIIKDDNVFMNLLKNNAEQVAIEYVSGRPSDSAIKNRIKEIAEEAGFSYASLKINSYKITHKLFSYADITPESKWKFYNFGDGFGSNTVNYPSWHATINFTTSSHDSIDAELIGSQSHIIVMKFNILPNKIQGRATASE